MVVPFSNAISYIFLPLVSTVPVGDPCYGVCCDKLALKRVEIKSGRRNQLALGLIDILFEPNVLEISTANGSRD